MATITTSRPSEISLSRVHVILLVCMVMAAATTRQLIVIQEHQHVDDRNLPKQAQAELTLHRVLQPRRGTIYDRSGSALALNVYRDSLYVEPRRIEEPEKLAIVLAPLIGRDVESVAQILGNKEREWDRLAR